jgi:hypothetical protein
MSNVQHSHKNETFHAKAALEMKYQKNFSVPLRSLRENFAKLISPPDAICNA